MRGLAASLLLAGLCAPGVSPAADERGMMLALSCTACHGTAGASPGAIPSIRGKSADYLAERLRAFRDGGRAATVMDRLAKGYSDEEIDALARYFASLD